MFTRAQIPVMLGGGADAWALNVDGSIQVKTPIANDTSVVFTNVPYDENFGYVMYVDMSTAATPTSTPIKHNGNITASSISNGLCTITVPIVKVTSGQVGAKAQLRIVK